MKDWNLEILFKATQTIESLVNCLILLSFGFILRKISHSKKKSLNFVSVHSINYETNRTPSYTSKVHWWKGTSEVPFVFLAESSISLPNLLHGLIMLLYGPMRLHNRRLVWYTTFILIQFLNLCTTNLW
jgi:hypothetical protein